MSNKRCASTALKLCRLAVGTDSTRTQTVASNKPGENCAAAPLGTVFAQLDNADGTAPTATTTTHRKARDSWRRRKRAVAVCAAHSTKKRPSAQLASRRPVHLSRRRFFPPRKARYNFATTARHGGRVRAQATLARGPQRHCRAGRPAGPAASQQSACLAQARTQLAGGGVSWPWLVGYRLARPSRAEPTGCRRCGLAIKAGRPIAGRCDTGSQIKATAGRAWQASSPAQGFVAARVRARARAWARAPAGRRPLAAINSRPIDWRRRPGVQFAASPLKQVHSSAAEAAPSSGSSRWTIIIIIALVWLGSALLGLSCSRPATR